MSARLTTLLAAVALALAGCGGDGGDGDGDGNGGGEPASEQERAIAAAQVAYDEAVAAGEDLAAGPCIAEELPGLPEWVADVAHDPREAIDDDSANQCKSFGAGEATHFVELTPEGELIQAR